MKLKPILYLTRGSKDSSRHAGLAKEMLKEGISHSTFFALHLGKRTNVTNVAHILRSARFELGKEVRGKLCSVKL